MADTEAPAKPGRKTKNNGKVPVQKAAALYHVFEQGEEGALLPVGDVHAKTAEGAVKVFVASPPSGQAGFAKKIRDGEVSVVVVPERNYTVVGAEEVVRRTLRITAKK